MVLKANQMNKTRFYIPFIFLMFTSFGLFGQQTKMSDSLNTKIPVAIDLLNANNELGQTQNNLVKISENLKAQKFNTNVDSIISEYAKYLHTESQEIDAIKVHSISKFYLENASRGWTEYHTKVSDAIGIIRSKIAVFQQNLNNLEFELKVWKLTLKDFSSKTDVPKELKARIKKMIAEISKLIANYEAKQKKLIIKENKLTDLLILTNDVQDKIQSLRKQLLSNLLVASNPPIWKTSTNRSDVYPISVHLKKVWSINLKSVSIYFTQRSFSWLIFILLMELLVFLFLRNRYNKLNYDESSPGFVNANFVLNQKWIGALLLILFSSTLIILQTIPLTLSALLTIVILGIASTLIGRFGGKKGKVQTMVILIIFIINEAEIIFWYFGFLLRYYIIAEAITGMLLTYYVSGFRFKKVSKDSSPFVKNMIIVSGFAFLFFAVAMAAGILGFVNLAALLTKISAKIPVILLFVFLMYRILEVLIIAGCEAGKNFKWNATKYCENIKINLIRILKLTALYLLIKLVLETVEIYRPVANWIEEALVYNIAIGSISISMGRIFGMIIIIVVSYFLANIFKVLFENSTHANKSLSKGFLFAINKTIGYIIITFGFILGFAYAGIDLDKFGLLAGALGVGIGFGLQNIVNNFISGLILLYERPVEVGDIITAGTLMGEVKSIGVRASKIRTFDGAEVVVPNGNIISNDLINWTLSDKKRRLEIKVGVEYGSNPNEVLKILQKVAVNNDKVMVEPAPTALFDAFGKSSLNFRLLAWVTFNDSLSTRSELSIAVYNALADAGIGIPFPQIDLHVKEGHFTEKPQVVVPKAPDDPVKPVNETDD